MYFTPEKLVAYIESGGIPVNLRAFEEDARQ